MTGNICAAVSEELALGLSLAGVTDIFIMDSSTEEDVAREWFRRKVTEEISVMILSKDAGSILSRDLFERRVTGEMLPVTVIIPGEEEDRRAADLIKRAIGMVPQGNDVQVQDQEGKN